jgi:hypothetical protein
MLIAGQRRASAHTTASRRNMAGTVISDPHGLRSLHSPAISPHLAALISIQAHDIGHTVRMPTFICCRTLRIRRGVVHAVIRQQPVSEGSPVPMDAF